MFPSLPNIPIQEIKSELFTKNKIQLFIKREDLIHPEISGNKWRKLKYNINEYYAKGCQCIVTFGGAYSNHIAATSAAGKILGIPTFGVIRGEEVENETLKKAAENGMKFCFVSREEYKIKEQGDVAANFIQSLDKPFVIPEGGANLNGLRGCSEILEDVDFDTVVLACGTGNTISGIISSLKKNQKALGIPVLKGADFLIDDVHRNLRELNSDNTNWELKLDYHFGGYAKYKVDLIDFIKKFYQDFQIKLDPVYTGKAMFALFDLIRKGEIQNQKVIFIHTGGIQGVKGFEERYKLKIFE